MASLFLPSSLGTEAEQTNIELHFCVRLSLDIDWSEVQGSRGREGQGGTAHFSGHHIASVPAWNTPSQDFVLDSSGATSSCPPDGPCPLSQEAPSLSLMWLGHWLSSNNCHVTSPDWAVGPSIIIKREKSDSRKRTQVIREHAKATPGP